MTFYQVQFKNCQVIYQRLSCEILYSVASQIRQSLRKCVLELILACSLAGKY